MNNATSPLAHEHALRVYWEDTDAGGIVYCANHLDAGTLRPRRIPNLVLDRIG